MKPLARQLAVIDPQELAPVEAPWGWSKTLTKRDRFLVQSIVIRPGHRFELESHVHRAEHWIVVAGTARVHIADRQSIVTENDHVHIPIGVTHGIENPGCIDLHIIEIQTGSYLEKDDLRELPRGAA